MHGWNHKKNIHAPEIIVRPVNLFAADLNKGSNARKRLAGVQIPGTTRFTK